LRRLEDTVERGAGDDHVVAAEPEGSEPREVCRVGARGRHAIGAFRPLDHVQHDLSLDIRHRAFVEECASAGTDQLAENRVRLDQHTGPAEFLEEEGVAAALAVVAPTSTQTAGVVPSRATSLRSSPNWE
jgi:hypothetical protein